MTRAWSEERTAKAVELWKEGHSAEHIARRLGVESRSAVLGKMFRMGLCRQSGTNTGKSGMVAARVERAVSKPPPPVALVESVTANEPSPVGKQLAQLERHHCRWPIGDPRQEGFHFCGRPPIPGRPYCSAHDKLAWAPRKPRQS
jgi:GcrA cell cycle regulator